MIHINKISDHWIKIYMTRKAKLLREALQQCTLPKICTVKERWKNRKCAEYCAVAENCPFGKMIRRDLKNAA